MLVSMARKHDLQADARQRAAEVPPREVPEAIAGVRSCLPSATGDLRLWLEAALQALQDREHLPKASTNIKRRRVQK